MDELSKVVLPALIALLGTLTTAYIGYRQWRKQQDTTRQSKFQIDRQAAYQHLWDIVTDAETKIRDSNMTERAELDCVLKEMRSSMSKNTLYIDTADDRAAFQYVENLFELCAHPLVIRTGYVRQVWVSTSQLPASILRLEFRIRLMKVLLPWARRNLPMSEETISAYEELLAAFRKTNQARSKLVSKTRRVLSGQQ